MWKIEGAIEFTSNICLLPMISSISWELIKLNGHYDNGILLHSGGIFDQPNYYRQAMEIISNALKAAQ